MPKEHVTVKLDTVSHRHSMWKISRPWNPCQGSFKVIESCTIRQTGFRGNHGPISYCYRDKRRFPSKIAKFSHPLYFAPPLKGFPWNWVPALDVKKKLE